MGWGGWGWGWGWAGGEAKAEESGVQGYPLLRSKCEASLGCIQELSPFLALLYLISRAFPYSRQAEIWKLWRELRQEEPQLAGNLEGFLAKMSSRLQEAQADREALAWTLRK